MSKEITQIEKTSIPTVDALKNLGNEKLQITVINAVIEARLSEMVQELRKEGSVYDKQKELCAELVSAGYKVSPNEDSGELEIEW